ncbi:ATP-binding protein [Archaeoglobus profundus]|uniref:PP-loop domain protein n=1 Tax=Archaeoglobus profundus (strain DSM 5631 / JCM 9629 / NBRC 100127 / Av18) TaxID=572546 RepID=D2RHP6_ARCPA|nr:ATP-binding protein [Archaeoglobus profundus]ADB57821.1 PP-loop domain protein [Archaeoglobus profundus DSM 5631]
MKCRCGRKAVFHSRVYRITLCDECFPKFYVNLVKRSIKRYGILKSSEKILVCVSGGKDSTAMAYALNELDYNIELFHIDLGIGNYSKESLKAVEELAQTLNLNLNVVKLEDYGFTIDDVESKKVCSACGIVKRYIMNRFARERGFDVIATAHTCEDIILFFIKNVLSGNVEYISKLSPRIDGFDKLVAKAKPLFERTEKENATLVLTLNLPFTPMECPHAPNDIWKEIIYEIEAKRRGFKQNFVRGIVKLAKSVKAEEWEVKHCKICGEVSNFEICSFCKIVERYSRKNR